MKNELIRIERRKTGYYIIEYNRVSSGFLSLRNYHGPYRHITLAETSRDKLMKTYEDIDKC